MPVYFFRPENALNRAREFIEVGKKDSALDVLSDIIKSKKHRQWSETHESIIRLYLELCIDLQKSPTAKDGLYQYRNICKETNLYSFQVVIDYFLSLVEEKAKEARKQSEQTVMDIDDLDMMQTPESLLLSTVSGEGTQDRTDRIVLFPWVKFLWESFRNIMELLKNNTLMESIYAAVAKRAFGFCLEYKRKAEFHKLCDILRTHLRNAQEHQQAQNCLKFDNQETIQCLVEVRFEQLDKAISIDLWQEAFRGIEDIHSLISGPKHKAKASLLENFYQKQSSVYWMANNKLFHAAALYRLFVLRKEQKKTFNLDSEEAKRTAAHVLLATLSVPVHPIPSEIDRFLVVDTTTQGKSRRLADLLRMQTPPTRASLLKELGFHGIIECVSPSLQRLYSLLEVDFNPLLLCAEVEPLLEELGANEETQQYVEPLKEVTLVRLVKQVSQIYQSIQLTRLCELAKFADPVQMERLVVETAKSNEIPVRIDHNTDSFWFGADLSLSQHSKAPEGPAVQSLPSELFCDHISVMAEALQQAASLVFHKEMETKLNRRYHKVSMRCKEAEVTNHRAIMRRGKAIEDRKEYLEGIQKEKENQEMKKIKAAEREKKKREKEKLEVEMKAEEDTKKRKEKEAIEKRIAEDKLEALKKTPIGAKVFSDMTADELKDLDANKILKKQLTQMEKEKKDKETRLKGQEKKIDYTERAKRLVEIPKRKKEYKEQIETDKKFHITTEEEKITKAIKEREEIVALKQRLGVMEDSKKEFLKKVTERRNDLFKEKLDAFNKRLEEERAERLEVRKNDRMKKRMAEAVARKKTEEEREAREKAEAERLQKEEEKKAHLEKMEQQRLIQMQREKEIEEKQQRKEEERMRELQQKQEEEARSRERERESDSWRGEERDDRPWRRSEPSPVQKREPYRPPQRDNWRSDGGQQGERQDERWERSDGGSGGWRDERRPPRDQDRYPSRDDRYPPRDQDRYRSDRSRDGYGDSGYRRDDRNRDGYGDSDRYRSDRSRDDSGYRRDGYGDSDRYRSDRSRDGYGDSGYRRDDRYRSDRDSDRFRGERETDRYRGPDRYERRGFDRSPRRDEGRGWRTEERRLSPPRTRGLDTSPQRSRGYDNNDTSPRPQRKTWRNEGGGPEEGEGWEQVTRRR